MDVPRGSEVLRNRKIRRALWILIALLAVGSTTVLVARLKPAAPSVEMNGLWPGTVKRGPMELQVHGLGVLKPEQIYWINAAVDSRVVQVVRRAGSDFIRANDVILVLSNPDLELEAEKAEWQCKQEEASLANLRVKLESDKLDQRASLAELEGQYKQARVTADRDLALTGFKIQSELASRLSVTQADQLESRVALQKQRLSIVDQSIQAQVEAQQVAIQSARAAYELKRKQVDQLTIRAGVNGVLQEVDVEVGQRVTAGTLLAKVADPTKLKAVVQIPETQMKDVRIGMDAFVDTRNGVVPGRVVRIDPAALNGSVGVDIFLQGKLPEGARPELSVDGTVEIARLNNVVFMERPVSGEPEATIGLFKIDPDGSGASRVQVKLGRTSVNTVEIRNGLQVGDRVILSDMGQYDSHNRIRLSR